LNHYLLLCGNIPYLDLGMFSNLKPSSLSRRSWIFGIGYGSCLMCLFNSLKAEMKCTVPSFLGIINVGVPHWDRLTFLSTPSEHSLSSSDLKVNFCILGTGKGRVWNGHMLSFSLM
jgi:hypothetical protein